ncbi:MAG: ABC transporter permease [bacterium]|uniref:Transport permease protein n=1 Tax=Candidatus Methylomirabilis tolerans TaxID=3123416 RepID=A0AAJ1ERS5_9BACT|nr:ABC transporter permease [Candidatus Methylomirabilis sp.]
MDGISGLWRHRALIWSFAKRDLLARYKGSVVGLFWSVIHPLIMLALYTFVFSTIMKVRVGASEGTEQFAIYLFCGMLPWNALAEGLNRSTGVILEHSNLIKRAIFPSEILPIYPVIVGIINQFIGFVILLAALLLVGHPIYPVMLLLPVIFILQFAITTGLAWIVAGVTVFIRDLGQMLGMMLTLGVFLTPIFYPPSVVPQGLQPLLVVNPMYALVEAYRSLILRGQLPSWGSVVFLASIGAVVFIMGYRLFTRLQPAFADVL